ncbi:MAG: outer membrane beta-barrel protein [Myxococcota bacterium]
MRSKLITAILGSATLLVAPLGASAASDEQIRLLEQRMAEMEDRLEATSAELNEEKKQNRQQRDLLESAGLVEEGDDSLRSKIGSFFQMVDLTGNVASSYNYRFIDGGDEDPFDGTDNGGARNDSYFTHRNADSFQLDQLWLTLDKAPTEESRAGFHADLVWGETAESQSSGTRDPGLLYTGYVSYLAPIGNGVRIDAGKLATVLGAEVLQNNVNLNVTEGVVFQKLQPFTHSGVAATTQFTDNFGLVVGVVNEVYRDTAISVDRDKAGYAQLRFSGDKAGINIGAIVGQDPTGATCDTSDDDCNTSVFDITATFSPSDSFTGWINFDWVRSFGRDVNEGDKYGIATAGRFALTDATGVGGRFEYLEQDGSVFGGGTNDQQYITATGTIDHALTEGLVIRGELRYDRELEGDSRQFITSSGDRDSLAAIAQMYYAF